MTGSDNIGYYLKNGGSFINNADITGNTGVSNIGIYAKNAGIINNADIILGDSNLVEHIDSKGEKYKTGYSRVGIYGENSNITNNAGKTIGRKRRYRDLCKRCGLYSGEQRNYKWR